MPLPEFRMKWLAGLQVDEAISLERKRRIEEPLNDQQRKVIGSRAKHILVAAGPGSGKTHLLVHKAASLLWMERSKPEALLILTFSRAAARELKRRLVGLAGELAQAVRVCALH